MNRLRAERRPGRGNFLGDDDIEFERGLPASAIFLRHLNSEYAQLTQSAIEITGWVTVLFPLLVDWRHFLRDEIADGSPECLVILVEHGALHV